MRIGDRRLVILMALVVMLIAGRADVSPGLPNLQVMEGRQALENWDYARARSISAYLDGQAAKSDDKDLKFQAEFFGARVKFFEGDYPAALRRLETAKTLQAFDADDQALYTRVKRLAEVWKGAAEERSKHFIVRYVPGKDKVLVGPALDTLEKAFTVLTADFQTVPADPVLVEIYPAFEYFTAATGLTDEDLKNSGTIAVCKYRRLMINSPRTLSRGYAYRDTLSHEFVHFLIYQRFGESTPIWLHEGIAKYCELRWRGIYGDQSPSSKSLLASALRQGELISFDRMHPSFAKLKTPSQGQLAFAEVSTVVEYLVKTGGWPMVFRLCEQLRKGDDYRAAIRAVTGKDFDRFWSDWIAYAKTLGYRELPGMEISVYEIRKGESGTDETDEEVSESEVEQKPEWRFARLGDLLRDRNHFRESAFEYERARSLAPFNPRILNKVGLAYFLAGDFQPGVDPLRSAIELYPGFSTSYVNLGRTLHALKQDDEAVRMFDQALDLNPFNPIPYGFLIQIAEARGQADQAKKLAQQLDLIRQ